MDKVSSAIAARFLLATWRDKLRLVRWFDAPVVKTAVLFNLETAVRAGREVQDFESELFGMGAYIAQTVKAAPIPSDYGSKDCAYRPTPTAVSRFNGADSIALTKS